MRQIVLDTETTGLAVEQGHRIIEIGCVELINRRLTGNNFHHYVNPERDVERAAAEVHGITTDFLAAKPLFTDIADELLAYLLDAELIIHNAPFDLGFLRHEFKVAAKRFRVAHHDARVIDTLVLARRKHPGQHNSLDALCRRYQVNNANRELHGALLDAKLLAQVYLAMTGGQTQLFAQEKIPAMIHSDHIQRITTKRNALPVITADPQELAAHADFLTLLQQKGACVWLKEEDVA